MNLSIAAASSIVPVGLFGLASNTSRVSSLIASRIAARSKPSFAHRSFDQLRPGRVHRHRIDDERVLARHRVQPRRKQRLAQQSRAVPSNRR